MENLVQLCLGVTCLLLPIVFALLASGVYMLGMGTIKLPGIGRGEIRSGKDWTTVPDIARKTSESFGAFICLMGTLFALIGFCLQWVSVNLGAGTEIFQLGGLNGSLSGIALAVQPIAIGIGLLTNDFNGSFGIAFILILISLSVMLIPFVLLISTTLGIELIAVPLGLLKIDTRRVAKGLIILSFLSLILAGSFFAGIKATVGGVKFGGSVNILGTSMSIGIEVANGYWITIGGLVLTIIGAIIVITLSGGLAHWAKHLSTLDIDSGKTEEDLEEYYRK
jgi:hypothetical protein